MRTRVSIFLTDKGFITLNEGRLTPARETLLLVRVWLAIDYLWV